MTLKRVDNCALKRAGNFDPKGDKNPKTLLQYSQAKRPMRKVGEMDAKKLRNIIERRGRAEIVASQRQKEKGEEKTNKEERKRQRSHQTKRE